MKNKLQINATLIICLLTIGVNNLWSSDIPKTVCVKIIFSDTFPPVGNSKDENPFKDNYQYNKDGKITHTETKDLNIKIEYDNRCNKQIKSTRIKKENGDSTWYAFTYDPSCQLAMGESSDGIKLGFKFDSKQRLITITRSSQKINIVYNESGLAKKISLGNRDYLDNIYDSSGNILNRKSYSWLHASVGTYRVLRIMFHIIKDAEILFNQLINFNPGLDLTKIRDLFSQYSYRPPLVDLDM